MKFRTYFKQNERGRSMVEILGVLAIIGVLSFGGIQGYKYAMDKHRANDIVNSVNMRATDIWHMYQDGEKELPDSPDEDAFPEYGNMTQAGFEIMVTSYPPIAFKTWVDNVPTDVCKKVLQENLDEAIKGLKFVQVENENGLVRYTGDPAICGESSTLNQMVFTSFLSEGGGAVGGIVDPDNPNGPALEPCVDTEDCPQECGGAVCDPATMTCRDACLGTDKPFCMRASGICVECQVNEDCKHKGRGWICDESNYTCTQLQKTCPEGTFRSQNGACINCDDGSNFIVLKDGQGFPDTDDDVDGYTMCTQCEAQGTKRWHGELTDDPSRGYCSFMCTDGYSYQSESEGCISCSDMTRHNIKNETISKAQCLACEGHVWYKSYLGGHWCQAPLECAKDEFMYQEWGGKWGYYCAKCSNNRNNSVMMAWDTGASFPNFIQNMRDKCDACPERNASGTWTKRRAVGDRCWPVCEQPTNADEQIEICKANPKDENCTRQWQNADGACFSCSTITTSSSVGTDSTLKALCENCGRRVNDKGYCVPNDSSACPIGQFLGANGSCYNCSQNSSIEIETAEISKCSSNCRQLADGTYVVEGGSETREIRYNAYYKKTYCVPICKENYIYESFWAGGCVSCGNNLSTAGVRLDENDTENVTKDCARCPNRDIYVAHGKHCSIKKCPDTETEKYYKDREGNCVKCSRANSGDGDGQYGSNAVVEGKELCNACGNRMIVTDNSYWGTYCRLVDPGVTGICNSIGNKYYSNANLTDELKAKAEAYIKGDYNGVYYRSNDGYCRRCDSDVSYTTTQEQCASCKNRRYEGGNCLKGLCAEGQQFLNTSATCVACSQKNVPVNPDITNLCSSCENRRVMTTGFEEQGNLVGLCVEDCPSGMWQDKDGKCYFCEEASTKEIGTDEVSKNMCQTVCGRTMEAIKNTDSKTIGYKCSPQ